ncbi:MAG: DNA polymerase III subunit alpha [Candidatus Latescibacterota bacterium]|nr:MAG: DNA polymerase III subunit alpha [Candidatus Latescibacterota bacterium]
MSAPGASFVHLHNHSDYSLLDGALKVSDLVRRAAEEGMPAVALTDHGNLFGAVHFLGAARSAGVKPIVGCEAYLTFGSRLEKKTARAGGERTYHLVLLAKNATGFRNLIKLTSSAYLEGFYYRPRIDPEILAERSEGLICLTACMQGPVTVPVLSGDERTALERAGILSEIFAKGHLFVEIQNHGLEAEEVAARGLLGVARRLDLPVVATNDCHYLSQGHADSHDVLLCIGTGKDRNDPNRLRYETNRNHFAPAAEMLELFRETPEALRNTLRIAEMVEGSTPIGGLHLPEFPVPEGHADLDAYLEHLAWEGLPARYPNADERLLERVRYELGVIRKVGYAGYFLIVRDFIQAAKERAIPVGPGRGSAAGSIVSYLLGITDVDPIRFSLLFERFLNPERVSLPDIDIDFCYERRGEVIEYVVKKYGERSVAQIITFGTMAARAAIRDVGRVLGVPYGEVDRLAKLVPSDLGMTLDKAFETAPDLHKLVEENAAYKELWRHAQNLEGMSRHASTHAAGVLIAPGDLTDYVPLYRTSTDEKTTQWDMKSCEKAGLLKIDFLGLRTLTVLHDAVRLIREERGAEIDLAAIPLDDAETYKLLSAGNTVGVFQLESSGMRDLLVRLQPSAFEDIIAVNALFRPGPLGSGMVDDFIDRKHGRKKIVYLHPALEPILADTYGVILYQEQVMQIANVMGGFSLAEADILRRAMGKKQKAEMADNRTRFVERAVGKGFAKSTAEKMFDLMAFFAGYGFNKSHSTAYALLSYQTAYLKTRYPREFLAASLTSEMGDTDRVVILIGELQRLRIPLLPPDVNRSRVVFTCEGEAVRFGLGAVKNVGRAAIESMLAAREKGGPFRSIFHFCEDLDLRLVNKRVVESLVHAGAFDSIEPNRAALAQAAENALERAGRHQGDVSRGQTLLFEGGAGGAELEPPLPRTPPWNRRETLELEKAVMGFYVSGHPLAEHADEIALANATAATLGRMRDGEKVALAGIVASQRKILDRKGEPMAFVQVEDMTGVAEAILFSRAYKKHADLLASPEPLLFRGTVSAGSDNAAKVAVEEVLLLRECKARFTRLLQIRAPVEALGEESLQSIRAILGAHPGTVPVRIVVDTGERLVEVRSRRFRVDPGEELLVKLKEAVGERNVSLVGDAAA